MSINELDMKVKELRRMADELQTEIDTAQDAIKAHMDSQGVDTLVSMNIETGEIGHCSICIGKDEPNPRAAYRRSLAALEDRIKEIALGATNTGDGKAEQIATAVSVSIVTENKEDCKR